MLDSSGCPKVLNRIKWSCEVYCTLLAEHAQRSHSTSGRRPHLYAVDDVLVRFQHPHHVTARL